jgi:uncharacterized protein
MVKRLLIALPVLLVISIYALLHVVVGIYLYNAFPQHNPAWILWSLGIASIFALLISRFTRNISTTAIYWIGSLWMGTVFVAALITGSFLLIELATGYLIHGVYGLALLSAVVAYCVRNAFSTRVKTIEIKMPYLPKKLDGFTIVQLTDIHVGEIYQPPFLRKVVRKTNEQNADLVVITGDLFDGGGQLYPHIIDELKNIKQKTLFVRGNHEVYEGVAITNKLIKETGITLLEDTVVNYKGIQIVALTYPENFADDKKSTLQKLTKKLNKKKPILLLRHEPAGIQDAIDAGVHLQLSGHTHNGQLWPLNYLIKLRYKYVIGLHKVDSYTVYIGPGVGSWGPPMRLGSRSEITKIILKN